MDWWELGPQLLGAVSGLFAAVAAFLSWMTAWKLNRIEAERDAKQARAAERYQAERLAVVGVECAESDNSKKYGLLIVNGSDVPVYDVLIKAKFASGMKDNPELNLVIIPPGQFIIFRDGGGWGVLLEKSTVRMDISVIAKGKGGKMVTCVTFSDASLRRWTLSEGRTLVEG